MGRDIRRRATFTAAAAIVVAVAGTFTAAAQLLPPGWVGPSQEPTPTTAPTTTTTTETTLLPDVTVDPPSSEPPPAEDTTTVPPETAPEVPPEEAPLPEDLGEGDLGEGRAIPPEAQAVINSIPRSAPNDNTALVEGAAALEALGVNHDEAMRAVFGAFPILGPSRWVDDWYFPRWTGTTFRYHLGLDMFAAYGTPVAAPADGVARISENALGGLTVRVVQADGTFWYLAHLAGVAEGVVDGAAVSLGDVVGYVGDSGNARGGAPHLHFAIHPRGGEPVPPKPVVDEMVASGAARVVDLLAAVSSQPSPAAVVATDLTRRLADGVISGPGTVSGPPRSELLWASAANPTGGAVAVADAAAASINESVDWEQRGAEQRSADLAWTRATERAWQVVSPLVHPGLRRATEQLRAS